MMPILPTKASLREEEQRRREGPAGAPQPELHPVMWVWQRRRGRWLLAIRKRDVDRRRLVWTIYTPDGAMNGIAKRKAIIEDYSHHTPIYAPRSTPE